MLFVKFCKIDDSLSGRDRTGNLYFMTDSDIIKGSMKRVELINEEKDSDF